MTPPPPATGYRLVRLTNGSHSIHSFAHGETCHPAVGPVAEAESLYVQQLNLRERLRKHSGEFVIWDVGLGAAANVLTVLRAAREFSHPIRLVSFDCTLEPLQFGLRHADAMGYFDGYEKVLADLLKRHRAQFLNGSHPVDWALHLGDFPSILVQTSPLPAPHAVLFDAYSPAKNPAMWTLPLFKNLFSRLDPRRACALPTYSRSSILRTTLLLAGFFVGVGKATGQKEETTLAANTLDLLTMPLDRRWLERVKRSHSAEPLTEAVYQRLPLSEESWDKLQRHPQFN
ncbi:MAG: MnmC family methyltransferase [Verrucomicrobiota bacterium]